MNTDVDAMWENTKAVVLAELDSVFDELVPDIEAVLDAHGVEGDERALTWLILSEEHLNRRRLVESCHTQSEFLDTPAEATLWQ